MKASALFGIAVLLIANDALAERPLVVSPSITRGEYEKLSQEAGARAVFEQLSATIVENHQPIALPGLPGMDMESQEFRTRPHLARASNLCAYQVITVKFGLTPEVARLIDEKKTTADFDNPERAESLEVENRYLRPDGYRPGNQPSPSLARAQEACSKTRSLSVSARSAEEAEVAFTAAEQLLEALSSTGGSALQVDCIEHGAPCKNSHEAARVALGVMSRVSVEPNTYAPLQEITLRGGGVQVFEMRIERENERVHSVKLVWAMAPAV